LVYAHEICENRLPKSGWRNRTRKETGSFNFLVERMPLYQAKTLAVSASKRAVRSALNTSLKIAPRSVAAQIQIEIAEKFFMACAFGC
jgi:hypothetical protein